MYIGVWFVHGCTERITATWQVAIPIKSSGSCCVIARPFVEREGSCGSTDRDTFARLTMSFGGFQFGKLENSDLYGSCPYGGAWHDEAPILFPHRRSGLRSGSFS